MKRTLIWGNTYFVVICRVRVDNFFYCFVLFYDVSLSVMV